MTMVRKRLYIGATLALVFMAATPLDLPAQQTRADSLEARIKELEARLDSLLAALAPGEIQDSAAKAAAAELEALRAAARAAAGARQADTAQVSRTENLNVLNPEISVTGDILGLYVAPAGGDDYFSAVPREFEFSFQAALDPYTRTKIFVSHEEDFEIAGLVEEGEEGDAHPAVAIEEGYVYWVGLPGFGLKAGKFRQQIGLYNRWHTHALFEVDRPLPSVAFLGEDGLIQTGVSVVLPVLALGPSTQALTLELARGNNEALFDGGKQMSFLGTLQSFWDLSPSSYIQFGASAVYGENNDAGLASKLLELDISYRWRPPGRGLYRDFTLKGEWYFAQKDFGQGKQTGNGGYLQANYRLNRRWVLGVRTDYLDDYGDAATLFQAVPALTWWQSEWVRLRLQYNYVRPAGGESNHTAILQVVWAVGPHKHETY